MTWRYRGIYLCRNQWAIRTAPCNCSRGSGRTRTCGITAWITHDWSSFDLCWEVAHDFENASGNPRRVCVHSMQCYRSASEQRICIKVCLPQILKRTCKKVSQTYCVRESCFRPFCLIPAPSFNPLWFVVIDVRMGVYISLGLFQNLLWFGWK